MQEKPWERQCGDDDAASPEPALYTCLVCGTGAVTGGLWMSGVICLNCYPEMFRHFSRLHRSGMSRREAGEQAVLLARAALTVAAIGREDRAVSGGEDYSVAG